MPELPLSKRILRPGALALTVLAVGGLGALVAAGGDGGASAGRSVRPLTVETVAAEPAAGYTVEREFVGRVEAGRTSEAGFELAGRVAAVAVDEGDTVAAGEVLARLDTARLEARRRELRAGLRQARTERELARSTVERIERAREFKGASSQEVDEARERLEAAEAGVEHAASRIASLEVDLEKSVLRAPFDATVVRRHLDEGRVAGAGEPVVTLQERGTRRARIGVAGPAVDGLEPGQERSLRIEGRRVPATVQAVLPVRAAGARTVDVLLDLAVDTARPGDLAVLAVERRVAADGFWLPLAALSEGERGLWTALVAEPAPDADGTRVLAPRQLTVLHQTGDRAYVAGGLEAGARVVASGRHRVVAGQRVVLAHRAQRGDRLAASEEQ